MGARRRMSRRQLANEAGRSASIERKAKRKAANAARDARHIEFRQNRTLAETLRNSQNQLRNDNVYQNRQMINDTALAKGNYGSAVDDLANYGTAEQSYDDRMKTWSQTPVATLPGQQALVRGDLLNQAGQRPDDPHDIGYTLVNARSNNWDATGRSGGSVGGGWVRNDEFKRLKREQGYRPGTSYHGLDVPDPFSYPRTKEEINKKIQQQERAWVAKQEEQKARQQAVARQERQYMERLRAYRQRAYRPWYGANRFNPRREIMSTGWYR